MLTVEEGRSGIGPVKSLALQGWTGWTRKMRRMKGTAGDRSWMQQLDRIAETWMCRPRDGTAEEE